MDTPPPHQESRRELAARTRELVEQCLMTEVPRDVLEQAAQRVASIVEDLKRSQGVPFFEAIKSGHYLQNKVAYADRNLVVGHANPLAPPMLLDVDGDWTVGTVNLGRVYEGAPGFIHGGVVSLLFDQIFGSIIVRHGVPGVTGELQIRYIKPTPVCVPLKLMARIEEVDGRHYKCAGKLLCGEEVLVRGSAVMIAVEKEHLRVLFETTHNRSEDEVKLE